MSYHSGGRIESDLPKDAPNWMPATGEYVLTAENIQKMQPDYEALLRRAKPYLPD